MAKKKKAMRELVDERTIGAETFRFERVSCGKASCKCARGELHGPYWYGYRRKNGRMVSRYIGKSLSKVSNAELRASNPRKRNN